MGKDTQHKLRQFGGCKVCDLLGVPVDQDRVCLRCEIVIEDMAKALEDKRTERGAA